MQTERIENEWQILLSLRYRVLQEIYDKYIRGLRPMLHKCPILQTLLSPPIRSILKNKLSDFIDTQTFENINFMQILPSIVSDWKIQLDDELIRMVQVKL